MSSAGPRSSSSARAAAESLAEHLGAELTDNSSGGELHVNVWLPVGSGWTATQGHSLSVDYLSDPAAGWRELLADMRLGVVDCETPDCDTCLGH